MNTLTTAQLEKVLGLLRNQKKNELRGNLNAGKELTAYLQALEDVEDALLN